jgi:predicted ArsR family transcriptional regulator
VNRKRAHLSAARANILEVLIDQPNACSVGALSTLTHQHPNTIREHLDGLVDDRLAVRMRAPAKGRGRPAWLYSAAPAVDSEPGTREYAGLASALAAQIARTSGHPAADAIDAGRMWGRDLLQHYSNVVEVPIPDPPKPTSAIAARRTVVDMLEELGFAPSHDDRVSVVKLHRCPLLEAAHQHPEVVCGVHLGVVRGILEELGSDPAQTERTALQPFSEPGACRLELLNRPASTR